MAAPQAYNFAGNGTTSSLSGVIGGSGGTNSGAITGLVSTAGAFGNASSALALGTASTLVGDAPSLLINGAFTVGRAITVGPARVALPHRRLAALISARLTFPICKRFSFGSFAQAQDKPPPKPRSPSL